MLYAIAFLLVAILAAEIISIVQRRNLNMNISQALAAIQPASDAAKTASDANDAKIASLTAGNATLAQQLADAQTLTPEQEAIVNQIVATQNAIAATAPVAPPASST